MNRKTVREAVELTRKCLAHFWQADPDFALRYCAEDVIWIGSVQCQFMVGKEETAKDFYHTTAELKPCHLLNQEFFVAQNCGNACTIVGRYLTTTDDDVDFFLQVQQRCTMTWELTKEGLRIRHIHVSNPLGELKVAEGERFVNAVGKMASQYLIRHYQDSHDTRRLVVVDKREVTHFLLPPELLYAAANGRTCIIYTASGEEIDARMSIAEFERTAGKGFFAVHRSYVVNGFILQAWSDTRSF